MKKLPKELYVIVAKDKILSCNRCYARTYEPSIPHDYDHKVDKLFEIHIGNLVSTLCKDCLAELGEVILQTLEKDTNP